MSSEADPVDGAGSSAVLDDQEWYRVDDRSPKKLKYWYTAAWVLWIAFFLFVEGRAIKDKQKGDTLSEHVWFAQDKLKSWGLVGKILYGVFATGIFVLLGWLLPHFVLGWW